MLILCSKSGCNQPRTLGVARQTNTHTGLWIIVRTRRPVNPLGSRCDSGWLKNILKKKSIGIHFLFHYIFCGSSMLTSGSLVILSSRYHVSTQGYLYALLSCFSMSFDPVNKNKKSSPWNILWVIHAYQWFHGYLIQPLLGELPGVLPLCFLVW